MKDTWDQDAVLKQTFRILFSPIKHQNKSFSRIILPLLSYHRLGVGLKLEDVNLLAPVLSLPFKTF